MEKKLKPQQEHQILDAMISMLSSEKENTTKSMMSLLFGYILSIMGATASLYFMETAALMGAILYAFNFYIGYRACKMFETIWHIRQTIINQMKSALKQKEDLCAETD